MKILFIFILPLFLFSSINEYKTDIYFGNGILTSDIIAEKNSILLKDKILESLYDGNEIRMNKEVGNVDYAYNETHSITIDSNEGTFDFIESFFQKVSIQTTFDNLVNFIKPFFPALKETSHSRDLSKQIDKYKKSILNGHKVLIVSHSQGNLFAIDALNSIIKTDIWMLRYIKVVSIASPAMTPVTLDTKVISFDNDLVAWLGVFTYGQLENEVRSIDWLKARTYPKTEKPSVDYIYINYKNSILNNDWKTEEHLKEYWDSNVHSFRFYMGENLENGSLDKNSTLKEKTYIDHFTKKTFNTNLAKTLILDEIKIKLDSLDKVPSQYIKEKEFGEVCIDQRITIKNKYTNEIVEDMVFDFNEEGKIYQADYNGILQYVRASRDGQNIVRIQEDDQCYRLDDINEFISGPEAPIGNIEVRISLENKDPNTKTFMTLVRTDLNQLDSFETDSNKTIEVTKESSVFTYTYEGLNFGNYTLTVFGEMPGIYYGQALTSVTKDNFSKLILFNVDELYYPQTLKFDNSLYGTSWIVSDYPNENEIFEVTFGDIIENTSNNYYFNDGDFWIIDSEGDINILNIFGSFMNHRIVEEIDGCYIVETTQSTSNLNASFKMCP